MLEHLTEQPEDKILMVMGLYAADPRAGKIDLGVGVYRDAAGQTPIFEAVKQAEQLLWAEETTKTYVGLVGDPAYHDAMRRLILGDSVDASRVAAAATPGGTGAVRQAFELIQMEAPGATIWYSDPTWPNHLSMLAHLNMPARPYRYFDPETCAVDVEGMLADLSTVQPGDVVLLHGCCHNPTGANLTRTDWQRVADLIAVKGACPLIDLAYQGFGDGLEEDAEGTRILATTCSEALIAASCSKNFGIYRDRAGVLLAVAPDDQSAKRAQGTLSHLNRQSYSFPPDHGTRLVTMILDDAALRASWAAELEAMRATMLDLRTGLATELQAQSGSDRFGFLAAHRGMFSRIGATPEQVVRLRDEHGVYIVEDGRVNIAGLTADRVPVLATALIDVLGG